jgi:hypothetical protein
MHRKGWLCAFIAAVAVALLAVAPAHALELLISNNNTNSIVAYDFTPAVDEPTWDQRILELVDAGVDGTLIAENLRRTPTERLRRMQEMARFLQDARDRRPAPA